jgi:hypothetical protein
MTNLTTNETTVLKMAREALCTKVNLRKLEQMCGIEFADFSCALHGLVRKGLIRMNHTRSGDCKTITLL